MITAGTAARFRPVISLFLRLALGVGFLSAVTDRFGFWGPKGAANVAWGDWATFLAYTGVLNPLAPAGLVPMIGWVATIAETVLGVALIIGWGTRTSGWLSGCLLLLFAAGMTLGTGVKSAFNASVLAASAAGFALATFQAYPWSVDALLACRTDPQTATSGD